MLLILWKQESWVESVKPIDYWAIYLRFISYGDYVASKAELWKHVSVCYDLVNEHHFRHIYEAAISVLRTLLVT
jgi:hypothetical protein